MTTGNTRLGNAVRLSMALAALGAVIALPIASATGSAAAATPSAPQPGLTAKSITLGQVDTLSGPVPGLFEGAKDGTEAYLDYVNSHGGVYGRKLKLDVQDDGFSAANYTTETQQLVKQTFALVGGFSLFDNAGAPAVNASHIPDVTFSLTASRSMSQYNYGAEPIVVGGARLGPLQYYKRHFGHAYQHVGTIDSDVSSAEIQSNAVINAMTSIGYKVSYNATVSPFDTDFLPDVLKMQQEGVQMVYIIGLAVNQVADLAQNMHQQGFVPKVFSTNGVAYDSSYIKLAGSAANGTLTDQQTAMYLGQDARTVPTVKLFDKWVRKVNPGAHYDTYGVFGWASAQMFVQALRAAGPHPTRAAVLTQLNKIKTFDASGLLAPADPAAKIPPTCWILVKVVKGHWRRVAPSPKTGFVCHPGGFHYPPHYKKFVRHN